VEEEEEEGTEEVVLVWPAHGHCGLVGQMCVRARACWRGSPCSLRARPQHNAALALVLALLLGPDRVRAPARLPKTDACDELGGRSVRICRWRESRAALAEALQGLGDASESADDVRARRRERLAEWRGRRAAGGDGEAVGGDGDNCYFEMAPLNSRCVSVGVMLVPVRPGPNLSGRYGPPLPPPPEAA
jgi:hypothetical protein